MPLLRKPYRQNITEINMTDPLFKVLQAHFSGVLSTHSQAHQGYPFGSVVPFCLDEKGKPLILISALAQHTKNIQANPKVSLTLLQHTSTDVQMGERLTLLADGVSVPDSDIEACAQRYYGYFPSAQGYHDQLDFRFYHLEPVQFRHIKGFGEMGWAKPESVLVPNPFAWQQEKAIVDHMNADHGDALSHYCQLFHIPFEEQPVMCAISGLGMTIRTEAGLTWVEFPETVTTSNEARSILVALARRPLP